MSTHQVDVVGPAPYAWACSPCNWAGQGLTSEAACLADHLAVTRGIAQGRIKRGDVHAQFGELPDQTPGGA